ncbi:caspase family protein [Nostoc sp. LEGE 06077]|nr:caspase family protein [Nostoc sp. LEGE 06077]
MLLLPACKLKLTPLALVLSLAVSGVSILLCPIAINQSQAAEITPKLPGVKLSASKRFALVVGIDDYPEDPLGLPVSDAKLVKRELESVGFEVTLVINPTIGALTEARDAFVKKIDSSGDNVTALFFFAGHGVQFDGHNYLIPAKSKLLSAFSKAAFIDQAMDAQLGILNYLS